MKPISAEGGRKMQLISDRIKGVGPLVAAFRSPPDEGTRQECRNVGSMNCNFFGYIH